MTRDTLQHRKAYALLLIMALAFLALLLKNSGLFPFVFADEYTYSRYSRLEPISNSLIPGYLYLAVYRLTSHCGTDFLGCARLFNALFFVASAPFIYGVARRVTAFVPALLITACALAAPLNIYTAHYMPEAFYFFGFWAFIWVVSNARAERWQGWAVAGLILGTSALIKPHSMLVVPAVLLYIGYLSVYSDHNRLSGSLRNIGAFLVGALIAKFALSLLLAGPVGLTFFGPSYNKIASSTSGLERAVELIKLSLQSLQGHLLAMCLLVGMPMAATLKLSVSAVGSRGRPDESRRLAVLALLLFANLVAVVALFSASVVNTSVFESINRLHMRYYDFLFPLLWIVVASQLNDREPATLRKWQIVLGLVILLPTAYALYTRMGVYQPNMIDSPELRGLTSHTVTFYLLGVAMLVTLLGWMGRERLGATLFIYGLLPASVVLQNIWITSEQRLHLVPDLYDRAGTFTRQYLTAEERGKVVVIGSDMGGMLKATFYMDNADTTHLQVEPDNHYDFHGLPAGKTWVLSLGSYIPFADGRRQVAMPGFALTYVGNEIDLNFREPLSPAWVNHTEGLSLPDSGGTWSTASQVRLDFANPLPSRYRIHISAVAFGPNIGKAFTLHAGEGTETLTLTDQVQAFSFDIDNPQRSSTLRIDVPEPTSPAQLGLSVDERKLGLSLQSISIESLEH
ncbi:DUF7024 domain-containing protein [Pseudomonas sp. NPDC090202]|uniref:DUF7024 domain-containing protein n=1 Tax=unclassified Pseudomonas TaxID=196821 RepID=UPI0037F237D3